MSATWMAIIYLFCLGFYCVLTDRNLIKIAVGLNIMEASILLLLVRLAMVPGGGPPIVADAANAVTTFLMVDPIPHALSLTAIVIGAATTGLMLSLIIRYHSAYKTVRLDRMGDDDS